MPLRNALYLSKKKEKKQASNGVAERDPVVSGHMARPKLPFALNYTCQLVNDVHEHEHDLGAETTCVVGLEQY